MTDKAWTMQGYNPDNDPVIQAMKRDMEVCKSCTGNCNRAPVMNAAGSMKAPGNGEKIAKKSAAAAPSEAAPRAGAREGGEIPLSARKNPNRQENEFMLNLMILRNSIAKYSPACRERARLAGRYVWRDIRLLFRLVCKIQDAMIKTMPQRRDDYYTTYALHGHYELKMNGPVRGQRFVLIDDRKLAAIVDAAMESECILCMREGDEIGKCGIRDALLEVCPPTEVQEGYIRQCEYRGAASNLLNGEDVTI